jgi:hypothetical protein
MSATMAQLLSSGEFCKLRYDTIPVIKVHLQTLLSIPITQKCRILNYDTLFANERTDLMQTDRMEYFLNDQQNRHQFSRIVTSSTCQVVCMFRLNNRSLVSRADRAL